MSSAADDRGPEEFWEDLYRDRDRVWSGNPNQGLTDQVSGLAPGRALDLGCGEGGDAIWLAGRGWDVTAVDVAQTALDRAADHAAGSELGGRIDWQRHELAHSFPAGTYDLVSAQFLQSPIEFPRDDVLRRAAEAVAPGGVLLVVGHAEFPPGSHHRDPGVHLPTPSEVVDSLDLSDEEWSVEVCEARDREGTGPDGQTMTLVDAVVMVRRHAELA